MVLNLFCLFSHSLHYGVVLVFDLGAFGDSDLELLSTVSHHYNKR